MVYTLSYQMYKYEHGLRAGEQRAADVRAGAGAAAVREARVRLRRVLRPRAAGSLARRRARGMSGSGAASMRLLSSGR
jgi:hypothetical protein